MNLLMRLPLLWKVLAAPVIAAVFFVIYLAFTTFVFNQNNERLVGIRDRDFPALEVATENVANLDKIVEGLNSAVSSGVFGTKGGTGTGFSFSSMATKTR